MLSPHGAELDLHLRITGGYFGERIDHDRLWTSLGEAFDLAGRRVVGLHRADRLLNACCHAVLGGSSGLRALHDIGLLAMTGDDWKSTVGHALVDGTDVVVARGIRTAWTDLELPGSHPAAAWAFTHHADERPEVALATYATAARAARSDEDRGVLLALSPLDKARYGDRGEPPTRRAGRLPM
jgi:hypothetical protein